MNILYYFVNILNNNSYLLFYSYFILILFALEMFYIVYTYFNITFIIKKIRNNQENENKFLKDMIFKYSKLLNTYKKDINTKSFVNNYILENKKWTNRLLKFIKESDSLIIICGLIIFFVASFSALFALDLSAITELDILFNRLEELFISIKPAVFVLFFSIIISLLIKFVYKIFNIQTNNNELKIVLINFLENKFKGGENLYSLQIEALKQLTQSIENCTFSLEDIIKDAILESFDDISLYIDSENNQSFKKIKLDEENSKEENKT